jgi:hypothetical protein
VFGFLERDQPGEAAVFFPGSDPVPMAAAERLASLGYRLAQRRRDGVRWAFSLEHPTHGSAELWAETESPRIEPFIRFANSLTEGERAAAAGSATCVRLTVPARRRHVLRDRKTMLRIARDVLGDEGLMVLDLASELPWSRAALADELAHDADLDIEALFCLHVVFDESAPDHVRWLHSHGLAALGGFDVDVLAPHPAFVAWCSDPYRAIATMILRRDIAPGEGRFTFGQPNGDARLVPAAEFMREADPADAALRDAADHDDQRSVLCEPVGRRLFGFGRGDRPEPLRFARRPPPDQFVIRFPDETTALMAERAAATADVLRAMSEEFAEFEPVPLVKLGYATRDGGREHLWFSVHGFGDQTVDATLENRPFGVDLRAGERADRPLELLSDWLLMTPAGPITPRSFIAARRLRERGDEIRAELARSR